MKTYLTAIFFLWAIVCPAQLLTPNVDRVSELISAKQEELKVRVLKNIVIKNIHTTNNTTFYTMHNLMQILITEKNKTVMTKNILKEVTEYSIAYALSDYFISNHLKLRSESFQSIDSTITAGIPTETKDGLSKQSDFLEPKRKIVNQEKGEPISSTQLSNQQKRLLANYVIDAIIPLLRETTLADSIGIFSSTSDYEPDLLPADYYKPLSSDTTQIRDQLKDFVRSLDAIAASIPSNAAKENQRILKNILTIKPEFNNTKTLSPQTVADIFKLFQLSLKVFGQQLGNNSFLAKIGDIISTYVILDFLPGTEVYNFKIDVEAIILALEERFFSKDISKNKIASLKNYHVGVEPFFTIGLNYSVAVDKLPEGVEEDEDNNKFYQVAYVGEKFGIKFKFADYEYTRSQPAGEWFRYKGSYRRWKNPQASPTINNIYAFVYASGLIYNIVDVKSKSNFDFAVLGSGLGCTFFNELEANISYTVPFVSNDIKFSQGLVNLGFDIPIFEYLKAGRK